MRFAMLVLLGCAGEEMAVEEPPTEPGERVLQCHVLHGGDGVVSVGRIDVDEERQTPDVARFELDALDDRFETRGIGRVGENLVATLRIEGVNRIYSFGLESGEVGDFGLHPVQMGGQGPLLTGCFDSVCVYEDLEALAFRSPEEFVVGPTGNGFQSLGETFYSMERTGTAVHSWDRDGQPGPSVELEGFSGWNLGFSMHEDRILVLENGLVADPISPFTLLRVYDREGRLLETLVLDGLPGSSMASGLTCESVIL